MGERNRIGASKEEPLTVRGALRRAYRLLSRHGLRFPREDSEALLAWVLKSDRVHLLAHPEAVLTAAQAASFDEWTRRRAEGFPLQYMRGEQEFMGLTFKIDGSTLIPRPETETVVEVALRELAGQAAASPWVLDVGTGSGCIAVSLARRRPDLRVVATDVSRPALEVARGNAERLGCGDRLQFLATDVLSSFAPVRRFDLVVSNPPYVGWEKRHEVDPSVLRYEPRTAVFASRGGTEIYRRLLVESPPLLKPGGRLVVELGYDLSSAVSSLAGSLGWRVASTAEDLAGIVRCAVLERSRR